MAVFCGKMFPTSLRLGNGEITTLVTANSWRSTRIKFHAARKPRLFFDHVQKYAHVKLVKGQFLQLNVGGGGGGGGGLLTRLASLQVRGGGGAEKEEEEGERVIKDLKR